MLKRRTRITARVFGILALLSVVGGATTPTNTATERVILLLYTVPLCVMWFVLLLRHRWAWWGLTAFYVLGLLGMLSYASQISSSGAAHKSMDIGSLVALTLATVGWPLVILLTDRPKHWRNAEAPTQPVVEENTRADSDPQV